MKTAIEIARLARDPSVSFDRVVSEIELFASRHAQVAAVRATECQARSLSAIMSIFDAPLQRTERS